MPEKPIAIDVEERDFESAVLDRSQELPVVVDLWAPWCAPCRTLGPLLERLAEEHAGAFLLARVNVDAAPALAAALGIRSIPAVKGFRDGVLVAEFVGAQPEAAVRRFLANVLPTEADRLAREGETRVAAGDPAGGAEAFEAALARDGRQARALLGLARLRAEGGRHGDALALLERVSPSASVAREAERLAAEIRVRAEPAGDEAALRARVAADGGDLEARLALGRALAARGRLEEALAEFLEVVRRDRELGDDAARRAMLDIFQLLGPTHPATERYRGELAKALFR